MTGKKPWYKSTTLQGGAVLLFAIIASKAGWAFGDAEKTQLTEIMKAAAEVAGLVMVFYGRLKADTKIGS